MAPPSLACRSSQLQHCMKSAKLLGMVQHLSSVCAPLSIPWPPKHQMQTGHFNRYALMCQPPVARPPHSSAAAEPACSIGPCGFYALNTSKLSLDCEDQPQAASIADVHHVSGFASAMLEAALAAMCITQAVPYVRMKVYRGLHDLISHLKVCCIFSFFVPVPVPVLVLHVCTPA